MKLLTDNFYRVEDLYKLDKYNKDNKLSNLTEQQANTLDKKAFLDKSISDIGALIKQIKRIY